MTFTGENLAILLGSVTLTSGLLAAGVVWGRLTRSNVAVTEAIELINETLGQLRARIHDLANCIQRIDLLMVKIEIRLEHVEDRDRFIRPPTHPGGH